MAHLSFILLTIPRGVFVLLTVGSVFLKIIKIILLVILALIGLILLLLIFVLAAPVRYQVRGGWTGELLLKGKVTWLYRILGVGVQLVEKKPEIKISVFGYTLGSKKKCRRKRKKKKDDSEAVSSENEETISDTSGESLAESGQGDDIQTDLQEENEETVSIEADVDSDREDNEPEGSSDVISSAAETDWEEGNISQEEELLFEEALDLAEETASEKTGLADRIKATVGSLIHRIKSVVGSLIHRVKAILPFGRKKDEASGTQLADQTDTSAEIDPDAVAKDGALTRIKSMISRGQEFLAVPSVKKLIGKLWKSIKKILLHLMPTDLQIDARVGMGDPAKTGQIMEIAAVLYAFYGDHIRIASSFEEEVKEGQAELTGRIIPGYLLLKVVGMGLRIILNKECRRLYKEVRNRA